jgi:hypothetical protein
MDLNGLISGGRTLSQVHGKPFSSAHDDRDILTELLIVLRITLLKRLPAGKAREEV